MKLIPNKILIFTCLTALLLSGCGGYENGYKLSKPTVAYKPTLPKNIKLNFESHPLSYNSICKKYDTISTIHVTTNSSGSFLKQDQMDEKFQKIASSIGADAVIKISKESLWGGDVTGYAIKCKKINLSTPAIKH